MQTADLFGFDAPTRAAARSRARADAQHRAGQGMSNAARRANRLHAQWCQLALQALRDFARHQVGMWTIESARTLIESAPGFPKPADGRAWGRVVFDAARLGVIVKTGKTEATASSNGCGKPLWKRGPKA